MSGASWPRYPPCASGTCEDSFCCTLGHGNKVRWPEVRGKSGNVAKAIIEKDAPFVTVVFLQPGAVALPNFCCNRVNVALDPSGNVFNVPFIG